MHFRTQEFLSLQNDFSVSLYLIGLLVALLRYRFILKTWEFLSWEMHVSSEICVPTVSKIGKEVLAI